MGQRRLPLVRLLHERTVRFGRHRFRHPSFLFGCVLGTRAKFDRAIAVVVSFHRQTADTVAVFAALPIVPGEIAIMAVAHAAATKGLIARFLTAPETRPGTSSRQLEVLTAREREVLALVATGLSNGEIADHLVVSPLTAKTHINRAMMKLGARDRAQLVVVAYQTGLVRAAEPPSQ